MRILLSALTALILSGCVAAPKTADEFRKNVSAFIMPSMETFEVNRPFKDVAATFDKLGLKCLNKTVQRSRSSRYSEVVNWNPTVIVGKDKAELHLQSLIESGNIDVENKGDYVMVVDAVPLPGNKTRVTMYLSMKTHIDLVVEAVKAWAAGTSTKCPDMTKT